MTTIPLAEARAQLSRLVDEAVRTHQRVEITRNGRRSAVLMGSDDYDSMNETLDVLADAELVAEIGIALAESRESRVHTLESVRDEMERTGRLPR
ncbi:MAG: type II toxin-antitoxin system Phd/YefM family antitoxin [Marmoricola sp.]